MNGFGLAPLKIDGAIQTPDGYAAIPAGSGYNIKEALTPYGAVVGSINASLNPVSYTGIALHNVIGWMPAPWL